MKAARGAAGEEGEVKMFIWMTWPSFGLPLVTSVIGGLITGLLFYLLGGWQLKREAERLGKLTAIIIRGLESAGLARFNLDKDGNPTGVIFDESISL